MEKISIRFTAICVLCFVCLYTGVCFAESKQEARPIRTIEHRVETGENLYLLAAYYLKNARLWKEIYMKNLDKISDPNLLEIGIVLEIPVKEKNWRPKFSIEQWRRQKK